MTTTNNRNLTLPLVGGDSGVWGTELNNGVMSYLDNILGATQAITINSSDVNLTVTQWNNAAFNLTGVLTGNRSLVLPLNANSATVAVGGYCIVANNTTGAFTITVKTAASGSTGVTVAQGTTAFLYSDTANVYNADSSKLQLIPFAGNPNGFVAGTAASLNNPPSVVWDYTNAALYFCTTTGNAAAAVWSAQTVTIQRGFDTAVNLELAVTHTGGNLLQVAVKTDAGTDPTSIDPVTVPFQAISGSNTTGAVDLVSITGALSMTTNATGASLGASNSTPFRIWFALFNNGGTAVLAMRNCSTATQVYSLAEYGVASTVSITSGATSAGVWYTPNGTTLSNKAFRIIGYCEYTTGNLLVTAGTYTADPSNVVIFGTGIKKPGDVVDTIYAITTTTSAVAGSLAATPLSSPISLSSAINLVKVSAFGSVQMVSAGHIGGFQIGQGSSSNLIGNVSPISTSGASATLQQEIACTAIDKPSALSATYTLYGTANSGVTDTFLGTSGLSLLTPRGVMTLEEVMG